MPLKVYIEPKLELSEKQISLARNVTDYTVQIDGKRVVVKNGLNVGDKVILIRQQEGKKYILIDRTGG